MKTRGFWQLGDVSDERLVNSLRELLTAEGRNEARIMAHLAELDGRRLHLRDAAPSLFEYCQKKLGLSDNQAYYRIAAARVAQKFPVVFELLERRQLHLTSIAPLAKHLTEDNHRELLGEAGRLSKRDLLRWLARRYPQPEVANRLGKLPGRRLVPQAGSVSAGPTGALESRSETHYRLQLNLSESVKAKLELARDLMSHANPSGDLAVVVERGLDLLIARLRQKRFGQTSRPKKTSPAQRETLVTTAPLAPGSPPQHETSVAVEPGSPQPGLENFDRSKSKRAGVPKPGTRSRSHIPHETRRQVLERDGLCCSYVSEEGVRCTAQAFLQLDHRHARARGGGDTSGNMRVLCHAHNQLMAEQEFGEAHQRRVIEQRRVRKSA
jgi:hypothetical protein